MTTTGKVLVLVSSGHGWPLKDGQVYAGAGYDHTLIVARDVDGFEISALRGQMHEFGSVRRAIVWARLAGKCDRMPVPQPSDAGHALDAGGQALGISTRIGHKPNMRRNRRVRGQSVVVDSFERHIVTLFANTRRRRLGA